MTARVYSNIKRLKLVAFDLDGTIWSPDMYQLWGGGAPFSYALNGYDLVDSGGTKVRMLGIISQILHELNNEPDIKGVKVAWVSCTDEPSWAAQCLSMFRTEPGVLP